MKSVNRRNCICVQIFCVATVLLFLTFGIARCILSDECSQTAGVTERCDRPTQCIYRERDHTSWDFFCCEDANGWAAFHIMHPLLIYIASGSFFFSAFIVLFWETFEAMMVVVTGSFVFFSDEEIDSETVAGILLGDANLQGAYGLLIGLLLWYIFKQPPLVPDYYQVSKKTFIKYFGAAVALSASFYLGNFSIDIGLGRNRLLNIGLMGAVVIQLTIIWILLPSLVQQGNTEWRHYPAAKRNTFFAVLGLIIFSIGFQNIGILQYLPNDYYQAWVSTWIILFLLTIFAFFKWTKKNKEKKIVQC